MPLTITRSFSRDASCQEQRNIACHIACRKGRLVGVPEAVIKRANDVLKQIEREAVVDPLAGSKRGRKLSKYTRLIFFDQPGGEPRLQEKLIYRDRLQSRF